VKRAYVFYNIQKAQIYSELQEFTAVQVQTPSQIKELFKQLVSLISKKWTQNIGCSFIKFILKAGSEDAIVNAPLVRLQSKNTNNSKKLLICGAFTIYSSPSTPTLRINLNEHPIQYQNIGYT
jgi:hypothetical protein